MATFNLGGPDDYRVPAAGLTAEAPAIWHETALLVVEILAPEDATFDKCWSWTGPHAVSASSTSRPTGLSARQARFSG